VELCFKGLGIAFVTASDGDICLKIGTRARFPWNILPAFKVY
jgi:hypothetical protein